MKLAGAKAEAFARRPAPDIWAALIHGSDEGVAGETADALIAAWQEAEPGDMVRLTEEELSRDPGLLMDHLEARPLLGGRGLVRLTLSNERAAKPILAALEIAEARPDAFESRLAIVAGSLKPASKLRKAFEAAKTAACLQVFADEAEDMSALVTSALKAADADIAPDALSRFTADLPGHRRLARAEIEKLSLYARDLGRPIDLEDVAALSATETDRSVHALIEAAFLGEAEPALAALGRLEAAGTSPITVLRAVQREASGLLRAHALGVRDAKAAARLRPPVYSSQWPGFRARLQYWPASRLSRLLARIYDTESLAKKAGPMAPALLRRLVSDLIRTANAR